MRNLMEALGMVGERGFLIVVVVKYSGLHTHNYSKKPNFPRGYHGLARGWFAIESDRVAEHRIEWKNTHPQSVS
jgi:hypothetical protein